MGGWRPGRAISAVAASIVVLSSCSVNRNAPVAKEFDEASGRPGATSTVSEGIQKETIPVEAVALPGPGRGLLLTPPASTGGRWQNRRRPPFRRLQHGSPPS